MSTTIDGIVLRTASKRRTLMPKNTLRPPPTERLREVSEEAIKTFDKLQAIYTKLALVLRDWGSMPSEQTRNDLRDIFEQAFPEPPIRAIEEREYLKVADGRIKASRDYMRRARGSFPEDIRAGAFVRHSPTAPPAPYQKSLDDEIARRVKAVEREGADFRAEGSPDEAELYATPGESDWKPKSSG